MHSNSFVHEENFSQKNFMSPDPFFYPIYSWVWNDALDKEEIQRQINEIAEQNIHTVYIIPESRHFRPNTMKTYLEPDYLSEEYFVYFSYAVRYGATKGITFWLYDEDGWPSGGAGGGVVRKNSALIRKTLVRRRITIAEGTPYRAAENVVAVFNEKCERLPLHQARETLWEYAIEEDSTYHNPYPDLLKEEATAEFLELAYETVRTSIGEALFRMIPAAFTDEPGLGVIPWTEELPKAFFQKTGYDIRDYLPALFQPDSMGEQGKRARIDYYEWCASRFAQTYFRKLKRWCHAHEMALAGHIDADDTARHYHKNIHLLRLLREFDIPGVDAIARQIFPACKNVKLPENRFNFEPYRNTFFRGMHPVRQARWEIILR